MSVTSSQLNPLTTGDTNEALTVNASFRHKYGIPPKGFTAAGRLGR
jgi:hypothetical protein